MAITKAKKAEILTGLEEKFTKAKVVYFAQNLGLQVKKITNLRKKMHKEGIDFVIAKKTLIKLAAKKNNFPELTDEALDGSIAAVFGYNDVLAPARVLYEFSKENEKLQLVSGVVEGRLISKAEAKQLAMLPPREQLLAKFVSSLKSPLYGLHGSLSGILRKFVYAMRAMHDKRSAQMTNNQ